MVRVDKVYHISSEELQRMVETKLGFPVDSIIAKQNGTIIAEVREK